MTMPRYDCTTCGTRIFDEDVDAAQDAAEYLDELLCDSCVCERDHFTCCACRECGERRDQHEYVVVCDAWEAGVRLPGLYRVTGVPYYSCSMLGGGMLFRSCVQWLGFLPAIDDEGYACGNLCQGCQTRALAWIADHHRDCAIVAAVR